MGSPGRRGIWRRLAVLTAIARRNVARRQDLRERAALWDAVRPALAAVKTGPELLKCMWPVTSAAKELAGLGDSPALDRADAEFIAQDPVLVSRTPYGAGIAERVPRFRGSPPPSGTSAPFDWYAWALAQSKWGERGAPAKSAKRPAKGVSG
jgi:hypothetical protein